MLNKKQIFEKVIENRLDNYVEFNIGCDCYQIKKLTDKFVILKSCFDKSEIKYYFDLTDLDDKTLRYLLKKKGKEHFRIEQHLSVNVKKFKTPKYTDKEKKKLVGGIIRVLGHAHMSEIAEILGINPLEAGKYGKILEKEGKVKIC